MDGKIKSFLLNMLVYKYGIILAGFLYIFPFTANFTGAFLKIFLAWGFIILVYDLFTKKIFLQKKVYWLIMVFVCFTFLTAIVNYQNNFNRNIVFSFYIIISVFIPLLVDKGKSMDCVIHELCLINKLVIVIAFLVSLTSFIIFIIDFKSSIQVNGAEFIFGTFENRLYGIMGNPNTGSLIAFISIFVSGMNLVIQKHKIMDTKNRSHSFFLIINIVMQFVVLFLGNSRSTLVCLSVANAILFVFFSKNYLFKKVNKQNFWSLIFVGSMLVGAGITPIASQLSNKIIGYLPPIYANVKTQIVENNVLNDFHENDQSSKPPKKPIIQQETEREYLNDDVSNGRITLWTAGFHVAKNQLLFGVGNSNIKDSANKYIPQSFLETAPNISANMHNVYLQILVGNGIFSLIAFLVFLTTVFFRGLGKLFNKSLSNSTDVIFLLCFALIMGICVENFFDANIIGFMCFFIVPVIWTYCGYFIYFLSTPSLNSEELIH